MNGSQDFLALTRSGNLGVLLVGIGILGLLIHEKPARRLISVGVGLLGILLIWQGASLFHGEMLSPRMSLSVILLIAAWSFVARRPALVEPVESKRQAE